MEEIEDIRENGNAQEMGLIKRMVGVFFSPGETFASIDRRVGHMDWLIPLIVVVMVGVISAQFTMPLVQAEGLKQMRTRIEQSGDVSAEKKEKANEKMQGIAEIAIPIATLIAVPVVAAAMLFVPAAIFLALVNFVFGGRGTYKKVLAVIAYASLIAIPAVIVTVPLILAKGTLHVQIGPGLLLPTSMEGGFLFHFFTYANLFSIWQYALVSIGLGTVSGIGTKRAAWGVFVLFFAFGLIVASVQTFSGALMGGMGK